MQEQEKDELHTDNMTEDALSESLNTDDSMAGTSKLDDALAEDAGNTDEKLRAELADAKDKYLRLMAEFENARRRTARERIELTQTAGREIISAMLDVLDDSERAAAVLQKTDMPEAAREGVLLVFNKLKSTLTGKGLRAMEAAGQDFDPELHEAITEIPAPTTDAAGKIVDVIQPGYYLNDKLIRHAKVVVGK